MKSLAYFFTVVLKDFEPPSPLFGFGLTFGDDVLKVMSQNKRDPFTPNAKLFFEVTQDVTEIDVEHLAVLLDHNVVRVSVSYTEHVSGDAVASTG